MIKLENVNKYYNKGKASEIHVVNDCNITLPDTGLITILGESGSGKTTLLNVIGGLDKSKGKITYDDTTFDGYKMTKIDKFRRENFGYIFQNYNLLPNLTIYDNLRLALELVDIINKEEVDKRVKEALMAVGLYKFRKKPAGKLSGGQMQRVAIARALVKNCKVLIADEPTGNLDSTNSIEIMNILKQLSSKTLVLLVTHDKQLAEFYSDQILELTDGKIVNIREAKNNISLQNKNENKVYLKDLNRVEDGSDKIKMVAFSEGEIPNIDITLVEKNGTFYIKSNVKIRLISDSNLELVNDSYHDTTLEDVKNDLKYDPSGFDDSIKSKSFGRIWKQIKNGFVGFFSARKRTKFLRFIFVILGVVMGVMAMFFCKYMYHDYSSVLSDTYVYRINNTVANYVDYQKAITDAYNEGIVDYLTSEELSYFETRLSVSYNSYYTIDYDIDVFKLPYEFIKDDGLIAGRFSNNDKNEVVIGKKLADKIVKKLKLDSYDDIFNLVEVNDYTIVGISKNNTNTVYTYDHSTFNLSRYQSITDEAYYFGAMYKDDIDYTVTSGRDFIEEDSNSRNVILMTQYPDPIYHEYNKEHVDLLDGSVYIKITDGKFTINDIEYTIVGYCYVENMFNARLILANKEEVVNLYKYGKNTSNSNYTSYITNEKDYRGKYELASGKKPEALDECMVNMYSGYELGTAIGIGGKQSYKVVGYYYSLDNDEKFNTLNNVCVSDLGYITYDSDGDVLIKSSNVSRLRKILSDNGLKLINVRDEQKSNLDYSNKRQNLTTLSVIAVLFAIALVYIYFTMRSKLISDIYEVGVLRNIGASKMRIYSKYIIEIIITTLFTTLLGYLGFIVIGGIIWDKISSINSFFPSYSLIKSPYAYLGIILIFVLHIVVGLLPIFMLLRKTPSEITSKYDI